MYVLINFVSVPFLFFVKKSLQLQLVFVSFNLFEMGIYNYALQEKYINTDNTIYFR